MGEWVPDGPVFHLKKKKEKQAGAELGQAQLKLGLGFTLTNSHIIARQLVLLYSLSRPTFNFTPL